MKDIKEIMKSFYNDYEEDPNGWSFWTDKSGEFYNIYIIQDDEGYFLKIDSIYTQNPIGKGTKIKVDDVKMEKNLANFGFRHFTKDELENFFYALKQNREDEKKTKKMIKNKLNEKPKRRSSIQKEGMVMVGPFNSGYPFLSNDKRYQEIDKELRKKLRKKFRNENPMYR